MIMSQLMEEDEGNFDSIFSRFGPILTEIQFLSFIWYNFYV